MTQHEGRNCVRHNYLGLAVKQFVVADLKSLFIQTQPLFSIRPNYLGCLLLFSFFTSVDEAAFNSKPTFPAFVAILDNYNNFIGSGDFISSQEKQEIDRFYTLIRTTPVFEKLYNHLLCKGANCYFRPKTKKNLKRGK